MKELNDFIAQKLLDLKAVKLQAKNPFEWNTGWMSPVYFDSRKILSYRVRNVIKVELARLIVEQYPDVEVIAAVAPNAIAMGMLVAETLDLPLVYVSTHPKSHGFENRIEGDVKVHQKVVIITDQLSLGINSASAEKALSEGSANVLGLISILDYEFAESIRALRETHLRFHTLTSYSNIISKALEMGRISKEEADIIQTWHDNPNEWKPAKTKATSKKR